MVDNAVRDSSARVRDNGLAMLTRRMAPEPVAAVARRCWSSAAFGAVLAVLAVLLGRGGAVDPRAVLAVLGFALLFALGAVLLAALSAVVIWRTGRRGTARALAGLVLAFVVLAYPGYLMVLASRLPAINDVSTDPASPPPYSNAAAVRVARGGVVHDDPSAETRDEQRRFYPGLQPVVLDRSGDEAYDLVVKTVKARGWQILEAVPPLGKFGTGHIDAVATTRIMALPDDVAIRIRPLAGQTRVDIRSASRIGRHDLGTNAARIQALSDELQDADS